MAATIGGGPCGKHKYSAEKQLRHCNFSITLSRFSVVRFMDPHKQSGVYMARGILLAGKGDPAGAKRDMRKALDLASFGEPRAKLLELFNPDLTAADIQRLRRWDPWALSLVSKMQQEEHSPEVRQVWLDVVAEVLSAPDN